MAIYSYSYGVSELTEISGGRALTADFNEAAGDAKPAVKKPQCPAPFLPLEQQRPQPLQPVWRQQLQQQAVGVRLEPNAG